MTGQHPRIRTFKGLGLILASLVIGLSCGEEELIGPGDRPIDTTGKPSAGNPTVTATVPNTAPQDTTLDVQVSGSGFDRGSRVDLGLNCEISCTLSEKVKTNSTRFVNNTTLVANITIAADAQPDLYDVQVTTTKGKRGIGIELFEISYAMTAIGTLPGDDSSEAYAISQTGEIVGGSARSRPYGERIFLWRNGAMQEVGPGLAIAASGNRRVLGATPPSVWQEVSGTWQETLLPVLPGPLDGQAQNITPDGTAIVGGSGGKSVLWRETTGGWTIEILPASCFCDINAAGMIVGQDRVWVEENGTWTSQTLAPFPAGSKAVGWAINDNGDVAGWSEDGSQGGYRRALLWRKTPTGWSAPDYLGSLGGESSAIAINNSGQVAGYGEVPGQTPGSLSNRHAFVWTPFDGMVDLGSRNTDNIARAINDLGQIVGASRKAAGGNYTAVLWELQ